MDTYIPQLIDVEVEDAQLECDKEISSSHLAKIPVTILTGFLGAGKTTLLNWIIQKSHGKRVCVIQNEFGEKLGLEEAMIVGSDGDKTTQWLELANGCICCSVRDDLVSTVEQLLQKMKNQLDLIIIEADGLARPGSIASSFWLDEELESQLVLDGIITVVDAFNISKRLGTAQESREAYEQIAVADRIILNKIDLVSQHQLEELTKHLEKVNPFAPILPTMQSNISINLVLGIEAFNLSNFQMQYDRLSKEKISDHDHNDSCCPASCHDEDNSDELKASTPKNPVIATSISSPLAMNEEKMMKWLGSVLWDSAGEESDGREIFRIKGIANIHGRDEKFGLQGVGPLFELAPTSILWNDQSGEDRKNKIVFIGRNLDESDLQRGLDGCS